MPKNKDRPVARLQRSLTTENLWLYILSLLSKERKHGYTIAEDITKKFGWSPGFITPYVVLYKLEGDKYIKSWSSGRRKYYAITGKGRRILKDAKLLMMEVSKKL